MGKRTLAAVLAAATIAGVAGVSQLESVKNSGIVSHVINAFNPLPSKKVELGSYLTFIVSL